MAVAILLLYSVVVTILLVSAVKELIKKEEKKVSNEIVELPVHVKRYTIITGIKGVGKHTYADTLESIKADDYLFDLDKSVSRIGKEYAHTIICKIQDMLSEAIKVGKSITLMTCLLGSLWAHKIELATENNYYITLYYIGLNSPDESLRRVCHVNDDANTKWDLEYLIKSQFKERFVSLLDVLPYCNEAIFIDNEHSFVEVARYTKGGPITLLGEYRPEWIISFIDTYNAYNQIATVKAETTQAI